MRIYIYIYIYIYISKYEKGIYDEFIILLTSILCVPVCCWINVLLLNPSFSILTNTDINPGASYPAFIHD